MTLSRRDALMATAALIVTTALPIPAVAAPAVSDIEATVYELLMAERYEELAQLLETLPADGDYPPLVSGLRVMTTMSPSQLRRFFAVD
jgi:hypothetical protein